ncbi:MAG TPA: coenzyme F420-0:L-glutamate ligase [Candidatus Acidoferrum sp.]|nr:coenzyme F420-0:L-glutamate ligase [Candidatus Acidoferrum sp.]
MRKGLVTVLGLKYVPKVKPGDNLGRMIVAAANREGLRLRTDDIVVVAQKIVSKAEGRLVSLGNVKPSAIAKEMARAMRKDPRHVETILRETKRVVRRRGPHLIVETRHGFVCANAGVDKSNVEGRDVVTLLPKDADRSARRIREQIREKTGNDVSVIVSDTFGRPWRVGQTNVAVGLSGMRPWIDYRGTKDMFGYKLSVTKMASADELAGAAELVMNKADEIPVAIIRGYPHPRGRGSARQLLRPARQDLFR